MNRMTFLGDKPINRMGFGAMQLAGPGVFGPPPDPDVARAVLRRAIELGVDHERLDLVNLRLVGNGTGAAIAVIVAARGLSAT